MYKTTPKYNLSFWESKTFFKDIDFLIVGSGIVGLSAAIKLKENFPLKKVVVFERGTLPIGASTRNAGFACFGSMTELIDDMETMEDDAVWKLVEKRWKGLLELRELLGDQAISYEHTGGYEVFDKGNPSFGKCMDRREDFNQILFDITGKKEMYQDRTSDIPLTGMSGITQMIKNNGEGILHTGRLMDTFIKKARALGVEVYFGIEVKGIHEEMEQVVAETHQSWRISAGKILIATNGFAQRLIPDILLQPARNQVLVTAPIRGLGLQGGYHYDSGYYYFRNVGNRILLGGARNIDFKRETTTELGLTENIMMELKRFLKEVISPDQVPKIEYSWSGIMGVGPVKAPIIRQMNSRTVMAVRLGGMGVAIGCLVGKEAAEKLMGLN